MSTLEDRKYDQFVGALADYLRAADIQVVSGTRFALLTLLVPETDIEPTAAAFARAHAALVEME